MASHRLSMSKVSLASLCSWSFRADAPQTPRPPGTSARIGTGVHSMMERYVKEGIICESLPKLTVEEQAQAFDLFSPSLREFLDLHRWNDCEIGLRYDTRTDSTKSGPRRGEPHYDDIDPSVLPGTLDLVAVGEKTAVVIDLKSGKKVEDRQQLYAQAVAASRYYDVPTVKVGYLYARKTKCDEPEWEVLDADRLDAEAGKLARLMRKLPMAEPVPGDHCWRCDARPSCPAYGAERAQESARELEEAGFFR